MIEQCLRRVKVTGLALGLALITLPASSATDAPPETVSAICDAVAARAAIRHNVPLDVLRAIALTETGRRLNSRIRPWPWTVNMEGQGHWFDTRSEARAFVDRAVNRGARSYDIGCFQINARWHGHAFPSLEAMFDPQLNADYAARFLAELHAEFGDWSRAAGAYHSRTPLACPSIPGAV